MKRPVKQGEPGSALYDFSQIHDSDPMAHVFDDTEIVGDKKVGIPMTSLKFFNEVEDLSLDGNIQGGSRFIKNDKLGPRDESPCDPDALSLPSAEFMGIPIHVILVEAHFAKDILDPGNHLISPGQPVHFQGISDRLFDEHSRIEGRLGVLKDDL
jgi:hypothetical protein